MNDYLNENYLEKETLRSYKNSMIILTIIFSILDLTFIIISSINLKFKTKIIRDLKSKVIKLFLFDIIIRILYSQKIIGRGLFKELFLCSLYTSQFYLVISFLDKVLYNPKTSSSQKSVGNWEAKVQWMLWNKK